MKDFCKTCGRVVPEGNEHDWQAHGSTAEYAEELRLWKARIKEACAHH
jgi:hypothetical protein